MDGTGTSSALDRLFDVVGTRIVITGAASGIGRAMAEVLAECGARVVLADRDPETLDAIVSELVGKGFDACAVVADVSDESDLDRLFVEAEARAGGVDVVFANAGIGGGRGYGWSDSGTLADLDLDAWRRVLDINLTGVMLTMRAAARLMVPRRAGKIIVTASVAGLRADPMVGYSYTATKAAVTNLVRHSALELAHHQVTVNAIAPGPFRTHIGGRELPDPNAVAAWARTVPLGRMASTDELKGLVVLLASPASSFMTGSVVVIDGGSLIASPAM